MYKLLFWLIFIVVWFLVSFKLMLEGELLAAESLGICMFVAILVSNYYFHLKEW